jgi:ATP-dependent DNA helicase RecG
MDVGDVLDRLGLRRAGVITQAAQVLYGTRFLPDYPQGLLKELVGDRNPREHEFSIQMRSIGCTFGTVESRILARPRRAPASANQKQRQ